MNGFRIDDTFPMNQVDIHDRRFMSRLDQKAWDAQVQVLMEEIQKYGFTDPVHIARMEDESIYIVVAGFTRVAAVSRLKLPTIRANVYENMKEVDARVLNAKDNALHTQLTDWERAVQMKKLKERDHTPVMSSNGGPSLVKIYGMSRSTIFNWLRVVDYYSPVLHQALAEKKIGLQQALVFCDYPQEITDAWVERCIQGEWSSLELKSRLLASGDEYQPASAEPPKSPTLDGAGNGIARESSTDSPTLDGAETPAHPRFVEVSQWLLRSSRQMNAWGPEVQQEFADVFLPLLKFIARHPQE